MTANSITTQYTKAVINATSEDGVIQLSLVKNPRYGYMNGLYTIEYTGTASLQGIYYYLVLFRTRALTRTLRLIYYR